MTGSTFRLTAEDFGAFRAERLHVSAHRRAELGKRATVWAQGLAARLAQFDIFVHVVEEPPKRKVGTAGRAGRPSLSILLVRDGVSSSATQPGVRSAFLSLYLDSDRIEVNLQVIAGRDLDALRKTLRDPATASELLGAMSSLPEPFTFGLAHGAQAACTAATRDAVCELVDRVAEGPGALWIGWTLPREIALEHKEILDEQLADALTALALVYRLIARPAEQRHLPVFAKGASVRILGGPFAGKLGVVLDLDGRGSARVMLGLLSARVALDSLAPAKGAKDERPAMKSSHRRPSSGRAAGGTSPRPPKVPIWPRVQSK
jgi:hypothetical protein